MMICGLCACVPAQGSVNPKSETENKAESVDEELAAEEPAAEEPATDESMESEKLTIRLGGLKGPTTIGMVKLLNDSEEGITTNMYDFTLAGSADELTPLFLKGELDIAALPVNLGAVLYNKSEGAIEMAAINTLGIIYIVEKGGDEITDIESLSGQTVYATGKGSTPEYALTYLLSQHGLTLGEDVNVEWMSEPTEIVAKMSAEDHVVAMLPQPYVTVAGTKVEDLEVALDLTEEWDKLGVDSQFITAGLFVRKDFAEKHPEALSSFLEEYRASTEYANTSVEDASQLVEKYDIVKAPIAMKAIPECNIVCITGDEMKSATAGYLEVLSGMNPESVGGKLPGDDFYIK